MTKEPISLRDRYRGCLLGGAVGDALGAPVEFMSLEEIRTQFGLMGLTDYSPAFGRLGSITDDSQMTLFVAEGLLRSVVCYNLRGTCCVEGIVNHALLRWLLTQGYSSQIKDVGTDGWLYKVQELHANRAPGRTCIAALKSKGSVDDLYARNNSKGCGGVMRVAPVALMFGGDSSDQSIKAAFEVGCNVARLTHGHACGYLAAGVLAVLVLLLIAGKSLPEALPVAMGLLDTENAGGREVWSALTEAVALAGSLVAPADAIKNLGGGWVADEALSIAVFCCLRACTLEEALIMAVNHSGDSDSTGSIAGNVMGAWRGAGAIPQRWLAGLELRDVIQQVADDLLDCGSWLLSPHADTPESKAILQRYPGC